MTETQAQAQAATAIRYTDDTRTLGVITHGNITLGRAVAGGLGEPLAFRPEGDVGQAFEGMAKKFLVGVNKTRARGRDKALDLRERLRHGQCQGVAELHCYQDHQVAWCSRCKAWWNTWLSKSQINRARDVGVRVKS